MLHSLRIEPAVQGVEVRERVIAEGLEFTAKLAQFISNTANLHTKGVGEIETDGGDLRCQAILDPDSKGIELSANAVPQFFRGHERYRTSVHRRNNVPAPVTIGALP